MEKLLTIRDVPAEMQNRIRVALNKTWNEIGDDVLNLARSEGKESVRRSEVIELVLDRLDMHGNDKEAAETVYNLAPATRMKLAKQVFTYPRYGM